MNNKTKTKNNQTTGIDTIFINGDGRINISFIRKNAIKDRHLDTITKASKLRIKNLLQNPDFLRINFLMDDGLNVAIIRKYDWQ